MDEKLLEILACPICKKKVELVDDKLICVKCGKKYPIINDVPHMLIEEAE